MNKMLEEMIEEILSEEREQLREMLSTPFSFSHIIEHIEVLKNDYAHLDYDDAMKVVTDGRKEIQS